MNKQKIIYDKTLNTDNVIRKKGGYVISGHSGDTFISTIWDYGESVSEDVMKAAIKASFQ